MAPCLRTLSVYNLKNRHPIGRTTVQEDHVIVVDNKIVALLIQFELDV